MGLVSGGLDLGAALTILLALVSAASSVAYSRAMVDNTKVSVAKVEADLDKLRGQHENERVESARRYMTIEQFGATEARMLGQFDTIRAELSELHRVLISRAEQAPARRQRNTGA
jgi:hypothetical protein